eukprot:4192765-Amphidinium_carterae.1
MLPQATNNRSDVEAVVKAFMNQSVRNTADINELVYKISFDVTVRRITRYISHHNTFSSL